MKTRKEFLEAVMRMANRKDLREGDRKQGGFISRLENMYKIGRGYKILKG